MHFDGYMFMTDFVSKFHNSLLIAGWFHHPEDELKSIRLIDCHQQDVVSEVGIPHGVDSDLGPNKGFKIQSLRTSTAFDDDSSIEFVTRRGWRKTVRLHDLSHDRRSHYATAGLAKKFFEEADKTPGLKVLDIGGRSRSRLDRSKLFKNADVTVVDILPGENVDVVGDAHELSSLFDPVSFDFIFSVSVFEHLLMPWKVVTEINKVLKTGGIGLVHTHQTLGMHDLPWDFWRFSDTAWDSLFNRKTGFEIIERALDGEQFVIPFCYWPGKADAEKSAGFEGSSVIFKKVGPCDLSWNVKIADLTETSYPDAPDGNLIHDSV